MVQWTWFRMGGTWLASGLLAAFSLTSNCLADDMARVTITLTEATFDGDTVSVPGLIRCKDSSGNVIEIVELLNRGTGLALAGESEEREIHSWSVLPRTMTIALPRQPVLLEAFSGIETELAKSNVDLSGKAEAEITIPLTRIIRKNAIEERTANTHLHIMKLSREECDRYLTEIPAADRLDVVFVSHLERAVVDSTYITNRYST
jgi:hypothetical protein